MSIKDILVNHLIDDPTDMESYWRDAVGLIQSEAIDKGIEFDGYFKEKWEDAAGTIFNFNEYYFDDEERRKLYVYLSALYDEEIMIHLKDAYQVASLPELTELHVKGVVDELIKGGTRF
ncbi:hypothetical protein EIZ47_10195 [Chryseobacterium lacus]|uniref:Uncharacterized protein n=1 Tax=Chryseobacterium lacus TaxID=2058346 RepID=A0A368MVQ3_9FLAO|nr:hypothetical protein [Chryseobacterium lacus]RCU42307.1 hypothetical protein DQ356_10290 [Chryseobacterium lacus]RST26605.1 hypothetical protein EIZ47_10195 [Chryseobacterium lacus]